MKYRILLCASLLFITSLYIFVKVLSAYESYKNSYIETEIGKFVIKINGSNINTQTFNINNTKWYNDGNVNESKIAPNSMGNIELIIDPSDSDTAVVYSIILDETILNKYGIYVETVEEKNGNSIIKTDYNKYTGYFLLEDVKAKKMHNIIISIKWKNDDNNSDEDSKLIGSIFNLKIAVEAYQYLGEEIKPYKDNL